MYDKTIDKHTFSVLLGQSAKKNTGSYLRGTRNNIINYSRPYLNASTGQDVYKRQLLHKIRV